MNFKKAFRSLKDTWRWKPENVLHKHTLEPRLDGLKGFVESVAEINCL